MTIGAVSALVFAAGPLDSSLLYQAAFCVSAVVLASGTILRRTSARRGALFAGFEGEIQQAQSSLESLHEALKQVQEDCDAIEDMSEFHSRVYQETHTKVADFLQYRQTLQDAFGLGPFAELMIQFASFERALHRSLSASADGYAEEAQRCLSRSVQLMETCLVIARSITDDVLHPNIKAN